MLVYALSSMWQSVGPGGWGVAEVTALVGAAAAVVGLVLAFWPIYQQRRTRLLLENNFGADFYTRESIEASTKYYVRPNCSSVDPTQEAELRQVVTAEEDLFSAVDKFLAQDSPRRHLLLLADSGMGKSSFVLNYYARNRRLPRRRRHRIAVVPLGIPNAVEEIMKIEAKRETTIFLDAFDEDTKAIQDHRARLIELMQACAQFKRVLLTCRTQFFHRDEEIPRGAGVAVVAPRKPGEPGVYEFWKLYLMPLNDRQVREFVRRRYPLLKNPFANRRKRRQALALIDTVPLLSVRPMLLAYIPDLLEGGQKIDYSFELYQRMIDKWLDRESHWVAPGLLMEFSERLAVDLYVNRERRGAERVSREELRGLMAEFGTPIEEPKATGRSLLNRDAAGNLKFAHRSIMEYLFVKRFTDGDPLCLTVDWTDNMLRFLNELVHDYYKFNLNFLFDLKLADIRNLRLGPLYRPPPFRDPRPSQQPFQLSRHHHFHVYKEEAGPGIEGATLVKDYASGLMWFQLSSHRYMTLEAAEGHLYHLNRQEVGGFMNWRLPTVPEAWGLLGIDEAAGSYYLDPCIKLAAMQKEVALIWTSDLLGKEPSSPNVIVFFGIKKSGVRPSLRGHSASVRTALCKPVRTMALDEYGYTLTGASKHLSVPTEPSAAGD